ncbi:hypothetical protein GCM10029978_055480 [Actinoallomurus acanthiterrae]
MSTASPIMRRTTWRLFLAAVLVTGLGAGAVRPAQAQQSLKTIVSAVTAVDGSRHTITNHLTDFAPQATDRKGPRHEWLLVWSGDESPSSANSPDPDFLAVVDVTRGTPTYGKVVNTVTINDGTGNEPHHMQYVWHKGDKVYAGGMFSDRVYVFDVAQLPVVRFSGVKLPSQTPCGSVPDAFQVLRDGTAYGTNMGGPNVSGPCRYTDGQVRVGNGFAGSPGDVARIAPDGRVLAEVPSASTENEGPRCKNNPPLPVDTCADPHGIAVREDLNRMVTSDLAEIRNTLTPNPPKDGAPDTVRIYDISDRNRPRLLSYSHLPSGPRPKPEWWTGENYAVMETATPYQHRHRGAFASTMDGAVFYTPDITVSKPTWREVFDDGTALKALYPDTTDPTSSIGDGGAWLAVTPDDHYLIHTEPAGGGANRQSGTLYALDIRKTLAAGRRVTCSIDKIEEVTGGGSEPDCPKLVNATPMTGGPHWGAMDNFQLGPDGYYHQTDRITRMVTSNYFVAATGFDGDHRVCMTDMAPDGRLSLDTSFQDENHHTPCLDFNRTSWPHGDRGNARPHGVLFVVADRDLR